MHGLCALADSQPGFGRAEWRGVEPRQDSRTCDQSIDPYSGTLTQDFPEIGDAQLRKSTTEPGGSDVFIVRVDADRDKAAACAPWSTMNGTGACCMAPRRFIVVEPLAEPDRSVCATRMRVRGTNGGSVAQGGICRELVTRDVLPAPAAASAPR